MSILGIFKKQITTKQQIFKNIKDLSAEERAWIEDLDKDGLKAAEIAENLGLDVRTIYNYRKVLNEQAKKEPSSENLDPSKAQQQIKNRLEITKMQLDCDATIQKMQLDRMQFEKQLREWKDEITGDDQAPDGQMSLTDLMTLMQSAQQTTPAPQQPLSTSQTQPVSDQSTPPDGERSPTVEDLAPVEMTDEQIRAIIKEQDKKYIKIAKIMPDQLIMDKIAQQFPTLSERSMLRAVEILRSEF